MLRLFAISEKSLVKDTSLSRFVHRASSADKKRIYNKVITQASEEQMAVMRSYQERIKRKEGAHA